MAISRVKTWSSGEVLTASDLNAEYNNILNNASDLVSPFTKAISMGGFTLNFDAANTMSLVSSTKGLNLSSTTAINDVKTTVASTTTPDIWTGIGGVVDYTGTATATGFAAAPQAGARRRLICAGAAVFTAGSNVLISGISSGFNYTAVANDIIDVTAITTTQFLLTPRPYSQEDVARPNLLINPNWLIDQTNEGALYTYSAATAIGPDGWSGSATGAGVFKLRTLADPDNAALKCLEITCTTADSSIAAGDLYYIYTAVEGYDAAALMAGTSSAGPITVQFKFKTSITGVYGVAIQNSAVNRRYIGTITVADTSEHEYSVSLTMDTTGTWLYTSGAGLYMKLTLAAGSTFQATAGSWGAGAEQTTSAQCNFMSANTNIAYLKRIQLIPGALVQAYRAADYQKEFAKAQRYYAKTFPPAVAVAQSAGVAGARQTRLQAVNATPETFWSFPQAMRIAPTVVTYNPSAANANWRNVTAAGDLTSGVDPSSTISVNGVIIGATVGGAQYDYCLIHATASARLS